jgi:hypothetical protein
MSQPINAPKPPFKLGQAERTSSTWMQLSQHLTDRLATLRSENDGDLSPEQTAKKRGQIAEIKAMLALAKDNPIPPPG